jgi:hypothetical protein
MNNESTVGTKLLLTAVTAAIVAVMVLAAVQLTGDHADKPPSATQTNATELVADPSDPFEAPVTAEELVAQVDRESRKAVAWIGPPQRSHVLRVGRESLQNGRLAIGYAERADQMPFLLIVTTRLDDGQLRQAIRQARTNDAEVIDRGSRHIILAPRNQRSSQAFLVDTDEKLIVRLTHATSSNRRLLRKLAGRISYINR